MGLVHFPPLEDFEGLLFERSFTGPIAHFGDLLLVCCEFGIERGEFHVEGGDARIDVSNGAVKCRFGRIGLGAEEAIHEG